MNFRSSFILFLSFNVSCSAFAMQKEMIDNFMRAAQNGKIERVKKLLEEGIAVNCRDDFKYTALHRAACFGHYEVVELLLHNGANVNAIVPLSHLTPLLCMFCRNCESDPHIAKILIENGAHINHKDRWGDTAFDIAKALNHKKVVQLLQTEAIRQEKE
jgi:ankyrin repeat protein